MLIKIKYAIFFVSYLMLILSAFTFANTSPALAQLPKSGAPCDPSSTGVKPNPNSSYVFDNEGRCVEVNICGTLPDDFCKQVVSAKADKENPIGGFKPVIDSIANIIIVLYGLFAVLILVLSGVQISSSVGNENVVKTAKENVFKVVLGLVLLISSRAILEIINNVFKNVNTGNLFEAGPNNGLQLANTGIPTLIGNIISIASFLSGIVAVIFVIVGGIRYITSVGNPKAREGAQKTVIYAIGGLVLSISAYGILVFIQEQLTR